MASTTGEAPSTGYDALQTARSGRLRRSIFWLESWLEAERNQLPLWLPVALGGGVATWFVLPLKLMWVAAIIGGLALAWFGLSLGLARRLGLSLVLGGLAFSLGCGLVWWRSEQVSAPVIGRPMVAVIKGEIVRVERQAAKDSWRVTIRTDGEASLPPKVRVSIPTTDQPEPPVTGTNVSVRARLMPPAPPMVPGSYDFRRHAWFQGLGASGKAIGPLQVEAVSEGKSGLRERLSRHIGAQLSGSEAGIATALATGDQGGISDADQEAMRASGLAHLLSISGLHISAVVAAAFLMTLRLLALSQTLALRAPLLLIASGVAALAGIGYTLLAGAEVPTVRSCIAAILVLIGMAMGREALTLRLVATGALIVLLLWPESLVGPSFQLSFAAITAIVALHSAPRIRLLLQRREENLPRRLGRGLLGLLLTGLVVEIALAPIALFHFHKSGLYGALANMVAIPLTTFVIMPAEALALLFDTIGAGAPFWWVVQISISLLLWLAHAVEAAPGAVAMLPSIPNIAYALMVGGGLWILLWRTRVRLAGSIPMLIGSLWALMVPVPDLLVTDDGRHLAARGDDGQMAILRPRTGDYVRDVLGERAAYEGELDDLDQMRSARCSDDACTIILSRGGREWRILATRSRNFLVWSDMIAACNDADIVVSDRRLPAACAPRWIKADPDLLRRTGGLAITLSNGGAETVKPGGDDHPWSDPPVTSRPPVIQ